VLHGNSKAKTGETGEMGEKKSPKPNHKKHKKLKGLPLLPFLLFNWFKFIQTNGKADTTAAAPATTTEVPGSTKSRWT
jgi:hypothetical protein